MHSFFAWDAFLFFMDIPKLDLVDLGCIRNQKVQFWQHSREKLYESNSENIIVQ